MIVPASALRAVPPDSLCAFSQGVRSQNATEHGNPATNATRALLPKQRANSPARRFGFRARGFPERGIGVVERGSGVRR